MMEDNGMYYLRNVWFVKFLTETEIYFVKALMNY